MVSVGLVFSQPSVLLSSRVEALSDIRRRSPIEKQNEAIKIPRLFYGG